MIGSLSVSHRSNSHFLTINSGRKMGSGSIPSTLFFCKMFTKSPQSIHTSRNAVPRMRFYSTSLSYGVSQLIHSQNASFRGNSSTRKAHKPVACDAKDSGPREEHSALETVLKLYEAIKNRNANELSDIIADECLCVSNFVSVFQPLFGKKQVLAFFSSLMKNLGNNIEFVVQQTSDDGMMVGVSWKLEWNKVPLPLGKGFSFYMCHVYQGKVMIKNVEIFMEPVFHIDPLRLKVISMVMTVIEKLHPQSLFRNRIIRAVVILLILLLVVRVVFFCK